MKQMKKIWCWLCLLLIVIVAAVFIRRWCRHQIWRSYHTLETHTVDLTLDRWRSQPESESAQGTDLRVVVLADLHDSSFGEDNELLVRQVLAAQPDLILMAGDMVDSGLVDCQGLLSLVSYLSEQCPVYYGLGNHEFEYMESHPELPQQLAQAGAVVLEEDYVDITVRGQDVRVGGMYAYGFFPVLEEELLAIPQDRKETYVFLQEFQDTEACKLLICHRPDSFIFNNAGTLWDVDLVVSGHVHGGQVVVPLLGGLWAPDQGWWPDYVEGLHRCGQVWVAITTGLGSQRETLPRFNNPPEILVLDINGQQ